MKKLEPFRKEGFLRAPRSHLIRLSSVALLACAVFTADTAGAAPTAKTAPAQPAAPSAAPAATAAPSTADSAEPGPGTTLPKGHPAVAQGRSASRAGMFEPPPDSVTEEASLPPGTIEVALRDANDQPLAGARVTLAIKQSSVAKGETNSQVEQVSDSSGTTRFDRLAVDSSMSYRALTTRGGAEYGTEPFNLNDKAGKKLVLHAYDSTRVLEDVVVGIQSTVYVELRDSAISVQESLSIFNLGKIAWNADVPLHLPEGFRGFQQPDAADPVRVEEVPGVGGALRGTITPGRHEVNFSFLVPLDDTERQVLNIDMPPRVAQARILLEGPKSMTFEADGFPSPEPAENGAGKRILMTERSVARAEGGLASMEITLQGLPVKGPGRWISVGLAGCIVLAALGYTLFGQDKSRLTLDAKQDLLEAQKALLDEIAALEKAHLRGDVGPKSYEKLRGALTDALCRILHKMDSTSGGTGEHASA